MSKSFFRTSSVLLSCPIALCGAASALAQEPSCELECIKGYSCELQISGCPELPRGDTPCEPTPFPSCIAQLCSSDADCAAHMRCYDGTTPGDVRQCLPQHSFSCDIDADCGAGFSCAPLNPCLDPSEPDCVPDAPEDGKLCWITETRACQADSDCLPDWTCENNPLNGRSFSANSYFCHIGDPPLVCMPPYSSIFGHGGAGFLDWAKGVERTYTVLPESQCPESTPSEVSYGEGGITEQGLGIDNDTREPGQSAVGDGDPTEPTLPPGLSSSGDAPVAQATSGSCSLSHAGHLSAGHTTPGLGLALLVGLAGVTLARRRGDGAAQK
jgi:hypothetical protein